MDSIALHPIEASTLAPQVDLLFYAPLVDPAQHPTDDDEEDEFDEHGERRDHWVKGFIRKLPPGAQPSEKQMAAYQRAVENEQIDEDAMGPGYTFVKKHHRQS